jgi:hypothetical protein
MSSTSATSGNTFQTTIVNSIRLNTDTPIAIYLYSYKNNNRSKMIAMKTSDFHMDDNFTPNFKQKAIQCYNLTSKIDQKKSSLRSVVP